MAVYIARAFDLLVLGESKTGGGAEITARLGPASSGWVPLAGDWDGS